MIIAKLHFLLPIQSLPRLYNPWKSTIPFVSLQMSFIAIKWLDCHLLDKSGTVTDVEQIQGHSLNWFDTPLADTDKT